MFLRHIYGIKDLSYSVCNFVQFSIKFIVKLEKNMDEKC